MENSCFNYFNDFIRSVYEEIGEEAGYSYEYLAYWFAGNYNLGRLNGLIGTCFSGSYSTGVYGEMKNYEIMPEIGAEESAIYQKIFELDFYNKQARNTLRGAAGSGGGDWISLKEGDSSITRSNKNEVAKNYRGLAKDTREELNNMVQSYLKFRALPQQVVGDDYLEDGYYNGGDYSAKNYRNDLKNDLYI